MVAPSGFLYPISSQFPFDNVTQQIVLALRERDFRVPGIKVELGSYGYLPYDYVKTIEDDDFRLWFCRIQRSLGDGFNDIAAVSQLNIPGKELSVYDDNSGPTFYLYVGKNWKAEKHGFVNGLKVNSKLRREPRTYLLYTGSSETREGIRYQGEIAPYLAHSNDLGREYEPKENEPRYFETRNVFQEFTAFLEGKLEQIRKR